MTKDWLLGWQNLIFIVPFGIALIYLLVYAVSGVTFGDADAEHDFSADADVDQDVAVDADADADVDHDTTHGHHGVHVTGGHGFGHDAHHGHTPGGHHGSHAPAEPTGVKAVLVWLGVGRVPLSILLMVLLLSWGMAGFIFNQAFREKFALPWQVAMVSLPAAFVLSLLVTRVVVRSIDRWLPLDETTARRRHDLLGLQGTAMYEITDRFGMVSLRDDRGELHQVPCRTADGQPAIAKNAPAVLIAYNARENLYSVVAPDKA